MTAPLLSIGPAELGVFLLVFLALASAVLSKPARRRWRPRPGWTRSIAPAASTDAVGQLEAVMAGRFTAKRVLSRTEAKVMRAAEAAIAEAGLPWRVMAQVALGEVLASPDEAAFRAINAKRVDLLIVSAGSEPLAAIEYQGEGHWQGTAPARDAVKKEALRKAGVAYVEITPTHGPDDVRREIARLAMRVEGAREPRRPTTPRSLGRSPVERAAGRQHVAHPDEHGDRDRDRQRGEGQVSAPRHDLP